MLELSSIGLDPALDRAESSSDRDRAAERPFDELRDVFDEVVEVEDFGVNPIGSSEDEELSGDVCGLLRGALDAREVVVDGIDVVEVPGRDARVVEDDADQIVEVVRNTC